MNIRIVQFLTVPLLLLTLISFKSGSDQEKRSGVLLDVIYQGLSRNHFAELKLNDDYSAKVFDTYIDRLDYSKRFLLKTDVDEFKKYYGKLDDEIMQRSHYFLDESIDTLNVRIEQVRGFYKDLLAKPFDMNIDDNFETDSDKKDFASDFGDLKERWRQVLKYQVLTRILDKEAEQEKALEKSDTVTVWTQVELEAYGRKKVMKTYDDFFHRVDQLEYKDRRNVYLNCLTNVVDPHTTFFPPRDKENFDISMTGQFEGIGATLSVRDGYITVVNIVPGSASYRQGELKVDDKILKVGQGEEEAVDVVDMRLDDAVKLIRGKKGTIVQLTVKKVDESVTIIPIKRDIVEIKETYAKSAILEDKGDRIGYIHLPKFYSDFNRTGAPVCSEDVKKEVEKLANEKVEGIIIDLRNNGGGSLQDVVKMGGLFVDDGPIVQVKARGRKPYIFNDEDKGVNYDGPLVVLVNSYSASASEILAAALQDYKRAVIVGSNSTYGKGTVQKVLDFDQVLPASLNDLKPLGALKVTMQKFYRIDGTTTQLKGVIPDVILPDLQAYIETGEKELDYALPFDEIQSAEYNPWDTGFEKKLDKIRKNSLKRVEANNSFSLIDENASLLKKRRDESIISLKYTAFKNYKDKIQEESKKFKDITKDPTGLKVFTLEVDKPEIDADTVLVEKNEKWLKGLGKDIHLFETVMVTQDLIKLW
jgi:carboxyl-terminal processing protease